MNRIADTLTCAPGGRRRESAAARCRMPPAKTAARGDGLANGRLDPAATPDSCASRESTHTPIFGDMVSRMKTTVEIEDHLFERAKTEARRRKVTLRRLVEQGLRHELSMPAKRTRYRMKDVSVGGDGLQPGIDFSNWEQIRDIVYEGHGA